MTRALLSGVVLLLSGAVSGETLWVGNTWITAATPQCGSAASPGDYARSVFRPAVSGLDNGADSSFSYVSQRASFAMRVPNNTFQFGVNYAGQSVNSYLSIASKAGGITQWNQTPASPGPGTNFIDITGSLANFYTVTGCTVTFTGRYIRLP